MGSLERLLDVVRRELGAADSRIEIGGRDPRDPHVVWAPLPEGWRVVALFDVPPEDPAALRDRLHALLDAFGQASRGIIRRRTVPQLPPERVLDEELAALAETAGARDALVVDRTSPALWGSSNVERQPGEDAQVLLDDAQTWKQAVACAVDLVELLARPEAERAAWLREVGVSREEGDLLLRRTQRLSDRASGRDGPGWRRHFQTARAVAVVRTGSAASTAVREPDLGMVSRSFGGAYHLVLVFDGPFSELHAEAALIRALPWIERLVLSLPAEEPDPDDGSGGSRAEVIRLPRR